FRLSTSSVASSRSASVCCDISTPTAKKAATIRHRRAQRNHGPYSVRGIMASSCSTDPLRNDLHTVFPSVSAAAPAGATRLSCRSRTMNAGASLAPSAALQVDYADPATLPALLADDRVLAVFGFHSGSGKPASDDPRYLQVGLQIDGTDTLEV